MNSAFPTSIQDNKSKDSNLIWRSLSSSLGWSPIAESVQFARTIAEVISNDRASLRSPLSSEDHAVSRPFPTTRSVGNFISRYNGLHRRFTGGKVPSRRGDPPTSSGIRPRTRRSRIRFRPTYPVNGTRATSSKSTPLSGIRTCGCYPLSRPFLYPRFSHRQLIISPLWIQSHLARVK